jgi:hypothetical protein
MDGRFKIIAFCTNYNNLHYPNALSKANGGRAKNSPSPLSTRSPFNRIASKCAPRVKKQTLTFSSPSKHFANTPPKYPPTLPIPAMIIFAFMGGVIDIDNFKVHYNFMQPRPQVLEKKLNG